MGSLFPIYGKIKHVPNHATSCEYIANILNGCTSGNTHFLRRLTSVDAKREKNRHTWGYLLTDISPSCQSCPVELWENSNSIVMNWRTASHRRHSIYHYTILRGSSSTDMALKYTSDKSVISHNWYMNG